MTWPMRLPDTRQMQTDDAEEQARKRWDRWHLFAINTAEARRRADAMARLEAQLEREVQLGH